MVIKLPWARELGSASRMMHGCFSPEVAIGNVYEYKLKLCIDIEDMHSAALATT